MTRSGPLILLRTPFFGGPVRLDGLPAELRGQFTADQSRSAEADAVIFHLPDFRASQVRDTPKYPGQLWVLWSLESSVNYPGLADPEFNRHFNLRLSYERTSDVWSPYLPKLPEWEAAQRLEVPEKTEAAPLVMFQSALIDRCGRNAFAAALMRQIPVDSYGRVYRNRTLPDDNGRATKLAVIGRYRFCLSLENSRAPDYVTEKLFDPLMAGTVPVYRGAPNAAEFAPPRSYIDADAHGGAKGLADYLRHLIDSPSEYEAYFAWRGEPLPPAMREKLDAIATPGWVRLLEAVASRRKSGRRGRATLPFGLKAAISARTTRLVRQLTGKPVVKAEIQ